MSRAFPGQPILSGLGNSVAKPCRRISSKRLSAALDWLSLVRESQLASGETATAATPATAPTQAQVSEFERWYTSQLRVPLVVPTDGAKVLVVKFNDFQCPACGQSYLQYKPIFAKYEAEHPGAVKLVLKDYPLNKDCNDNMVQTLHPAACDAAVAVRLAQAHNKTDAMEEWLYTHQPTMTPPGVRQAAHDLGQIADFDAKDPPPLSLPSAVSVFGPY